MIRITPIIPANLNIKGMKKAILQALDAEGKDLVKSFELTTATWQGEKPTFTPIGTVSGGTAFVKVGPTGNKEGYFFAPRLKH